MDKQNIAVFLGGKSCEHDISIITGVQVINALDTSKYTVFPIYISREGVFLTGKGLDKIETYLGDVRYLKEVFIKPASKTLFSKRGKPIARLDGAVICCHGLNGEDGSLQGYLQMCGIPYTSGGILASSVGMDKIAMKMLFKSAKLKVLPYACVTRGEYENAPDHQRFLADAIGGTMRFPLIVKPANLGSSIGISVAKDAEELMSCVEVGFKYDTRVLIENALTDFTEYNCAVLGMDADARTSAVEQPVSWQQFLSFEEKYMGNGQKGMSGLKRKLPADISAQLEGQIKRDALKAFHALNCKGVARIDFIFDNTDQRLYINEINTIPGSLSFYLFEGDGISFSKLLDRLIKLAKAEFKAQSSLEYAYKTTVLSQKANSKLVGSKVK